MITGLNSAVPKEWANVMNADSDAMIFGYHTLCLLNAKALMQLCFLLKHHFIAYESALIERAWMFYGDVTELIWILLNTNGWILDLFFFLKNKKQKKKKMGSFDNIMWWMQKAYVVNNF